MIRNLLVDRSNHENTAIIDGDREVSYRELMDKARALQQYLPSDKAENIAIMLPDSGDFIAAVWGAIEAGYTAFPLNVLMTEHEIAPLLEHARVTTVITSSAYRRLLDEVAVRCTLTLNILYMEELDATLNLENVRTAAADPDKPMVLLSTSGTTGKCKIVQLSERNVAASVHGYLDKLRFEEAEADSTRYALAAPFSSVYGIMILSACLMRSFPVVTVNQPFTLDSFYRTAEKHRITRYEGSASPILLMEQMIGRPIPYDISALTYFGTGGSKVSGHTIEKLHSAYAGKGFYQGYGMTEAAPLITKHIQAGITKMASVGTAIKGLEIAIETEDGIVKTPYTQGQIIVRGDNVMLGYLDNESETEQVLKNGYLYTGDIGYLDEQGYLYICGRKKSMIIVRGFKVYPEEVEESILNSCLAKDCVVYGRADALGGEIVCADIVPIDSDVQADAIRKYCASHLAEYKLPRKITFCDSIKKNTSGKTERLEER